MIEEYLYLQPKHEYKFHTETIELIYGQDHEIFFAKGSANNLIVFIHGFNGSALKTWNEFPSLLRENEAFAESDVIFYGYPSLIYQASDHAGDFYDFLKNINKSSLIDNHIHKALDKKKLPKRNYENIIIVAHSLGAIITREALRYAHIDKSDWINKISMVLFAPAHNGAHVKRLLFDTLDILMLTKIIGSALQYKMPVIKDLEENSLILRELKKYTEELLTKNQGDFTKAKIVVHSKGDKIVNNNRYCEDVDSFRIENKSHSEVCKPNETYRKPIEYIIDLIK